MAYIEWIIEHSSDNLNKVLCPIGNYKELSKLHTNINIILTFGLGIVGNKRRNEKIIKYKKEFHIKYFEALWKSNRKYSVTLSLAAVLN